MAVEKMNRKGQMFLIAMIFVLISFLILRNVLDIYDVFEEKRAQEIKTEDLEMRNIVREYQHAAGIASMQADINRSGQDYIFNFSSFVRDTRGAKMLYLFAYANGSTGKYSVTLGNFLSDNVNATLSGTNTAPASSQFTLGDRRNQTLEFNFTANGTVELNLTYTTANQDRKDLLNLSVQSPSLFITLMTDITLEEKDISVRYKDIYNRTWRVP
ncbi:MAG: hypothetical protein HYW27_01425 [Candidatus Aenigmarchaeota archaeon]|nr:hypothetical protein [Candidatus Aenigmarchaeota archaeon]